jgi:hypothetical protein
MDRLDMNYPPRGSSWIEPFVAAIVVDREAAENPRNPHGRMILPGIATG